jgi:hypothetical protein
MRTCLSTEQVTMPCGFLSKLIWETLPLCASHWHLLRLAWELTAFLLFGCCCSLNSQGGGILREVDQCFGIVGGVYLSVFLGVERWSESGDTWNLFVAFQFEICHKVMEVPHVDKAQLVAYEEQLVFSGGLAPKLEVGAVDAHIQIAVLFLDHSVPHSNC